MLTPQGHVKVMDFGLAKQVTPVEGQEQEITTALTKQGSTLGTVPYMSPEQVRGQEVGTRSDIFSFGVVLYEMLTGVNPFKRDTSVDTSHAILGETPHPLTRYTEDIPVLLQHIVKKMLAKDQDRRYQLIHDVRTDLGEMIEKGGDLQEIRGETQEALASATVIPDRPGWQRTIPVVAALLVGAIMASLAVWNLRPSPETATGSIARFVLPLTLDGNRLSNELAITTQGSHLAVAPDGRHLAFIGRKDGVSKLYLRSMTSLETKALADVDDEYPPPFFSPDGQWIGFFDAGKLKKIPVTGGVPVVLCDAPSGRGGSWGEGGTIVFTPQSRGTGLLRVSAEGGTPEPITTLDPSKGETSHRLPHLLPGGEAVLFAAYGATYQDVQIIAQSLQTGERRVLIDGGSQPRYSLSGHLLYVQPRLGGTVMAVGFDTVWLELTGTPVPVLEGVRAGRGDRTGWSFSDTGMLASFPGNSGMPKKKLVWVNRNGESEPLDLPPGPYLFPRLSPDGRQLVLVNNGLQRNLWIYNLAANTSTPLTFQWNNSWPLWTSDGKRVVYASNREEPWDLFWKSADGSGKEERLLEKQYLQQPYSFSPDGKMLAFLHSDPTTAQDVWVLPLDGQPRPRPLLQTAAAETDAEFSPDGRFLAYTSNESGRNEVYVRPFPNVEEGKWQISTQGGMEPTWAGSGQELFYRNQSGDKMMKVDITSGSTFRAGSPRLLFEGSYDIQSARRQYDVTSDGRRFLMTQGVEPEAETVGQINIVLNWFEELKERVPVP